MLKSLIPKYVAKRDFRSASAGAGFLFNVQLQTGRYVEALKLAEEKTAYTRQAGLGPWTQLLDEGHRLQAMNSLGRYEEVLKVVKALREQMRSLPMEIREQEETVVPWNVREGILDTGREAAMRSEKFDLALELNAELIDEVKSRGATDLHLARTSFNDYFPLIRLKRQDEAWGLLWACKAVFERERSIEGLGMVFTAFANLMNESGQVDQAVSFQETGLRYSYIFGDPESIAIDHHNLAVYLAKSGSKSALDHRLAGFVIRYQIGSGILASSLKGLACDLDKFGPEALPGSFNQLCDRVERVDGVRFRELYERMPNRVEDSNQLLKELVEMARSAQDNV